MVDFSKRDRALKKVYAKEKDKFIRSDNCPVCDSKRIAFFRKNWLVDLYECKKCGHIFVNPMPSEKFIYDYYINSPYNDTIDFKFMMRRIKEKSGYLKFFEENPKNKVWLDIGSGYGELLFLAKLKGYKILSNELEPYLREYQKEKFEIKDFIDSIEKVKDNSIDIISMIHVLEHIDDISKQVNLIHSKLKKGGKALIEVPNKNYFLYPAYKMDRVTNLHLHDFCRQSLKLIFEKKGFKIDILDSRSFFLQITSNPYKNFAARVFFHINKVSQKVVGNRDQVLFMIAEKK